MPSNSDQRTPGVTGNGYIDAGRSASPFASAEIPHGHAYFQHLSWKLRWQLLVAYVTPLLILTVYFHGQYNKTLREGIDTHLKSVAENQRNTVDLYLEERTVNLRGMLRSVEQFEPPPDGAMTSALEQLRSDSDAFVDVGLFSPDGTLVSYAGPYANLQGRDYSGEDWFKRAIAAEDGKTISDVYLGFRDQPHFIIAVTREVSGQLWSLRASVDPEQFAEFVGSSHLIAEADAFIVNRDGQPQTFCAGVARDQAVPSELLGHTETTVDEVAFDGSVYLAAAAALRKSDWSLVVRVPKAQAYAPLRRAETVVGGIMLATLALVVVVALRSTHKLVGRLEAADAARDDLRRQLFNAAKLASVGEMAAGVAHEINNPLAIVYEEAGLMLDTLDPQFGREPDMEDFRERLNAISAATIRGRDITRQLLAFSRKDEPLPIDLAVNRLVLHALAVKETDFLVSNIEVTTSLSDTLPTIRADRNQLEQVLLNLLNNARDAIGNDGRIRVTTRLAGDELQILVGDDGCGMSQELMEKVFFPFFTTKEVGKGTGLGLSISYGIIKGLGGNIEAQSEVGKGTTFTVTLPLAERSGRAVFSRGRRGPDD